MSAQSQGYPERIERLLAELGLPADYEKARGLVLQPECSATIVADHDPDGAEIRLSPETAPAWQALKAAALAEAVLLVPYSGFRSVERQAELVRRKQKAGMPVAEILRYTAAPGYSEHHTGRAIDIGTLDQPPLEEVFEQTPAFRWLQANAAQFRFRMSYPRANRHGIGYEPWHWLLT